VCRRWTLEQDLDAHDRAVASTAGWADRLDGGRLDGGRLDGGRLDGGRLDGAA
jgi:hypothetical protein